MNVDSGTEVISAALDGEAVDVETLRSVLADPRSRDLLAAFVLLRAAAASDRDAAGCAPSSDAAACPRSLAAPPSRAWVRLARAASVVLVASSAAFWAGMHWTTAVSLPPVVSAVTRPIPSALPKVEEQVSCGVEAGEAPPPPVRTVHFSAREWQGS